MVRDNNKLFAGAGIIVRKPGGPEAGGSIVVVETEYAAQVSRLIFALKEVFKGSLDYFNKYEFYGRLAAAANEQLCICDDPEALRAAIISEACVIASEMGKHLYFAYGSNMDDGQMAYRCPEAVFVGTAELRGFAFELDSEGVATVVEKPGSTVYGVLWLISETDERTLDSYEGVVSSCYRKAVHPVRDGAGRSLPALVYISNRGVHDGVTYRFGYLENIVRNARRLGFDEAYVEGIEAN